MTAKTALAAMTKGEYRKKLEDAGFDPNQENDAIAEIPKWIKAKKLGLNAVPPDAPDHQFPFSDEVMDIISARKAGEDLRQMIASEQINYRPKNEGIRFYSLERITVDDLRNELGPKLESLGFTFDGNQPTAIVGTITSGLTKGTPYIEIPQISREEAKNFVAILGLKMNDIAAIHFLKTLELAQGSSALLTPFN